MGLCADAFGLAGWWVSFDPLRTFCFVSAAPKSSFTPPPTGEPT